MPSLDVTEVLTDPLFAETFVVNRRTETVGTNGRAVLTPTVFPRVVGVVCMASANDLERLDDNQRMGRHLSIVTKFALQGPSPGMQADTVEWGGDTFIVQSLDPYTHFGAGFVQAICGSMDYQDQPPGP